MEKDEPLTGLLYSFSYAKEDSERIYKSFQNGNELWHEDKISETAREIKSTLTFSYAAMNTCFNRYFEGKRSERGSMKHKLEAMGYKFQKHSLWEIPRDEMAKIRQSYELDGGFANLVDIVQRETMGENGIRKHCVDTRFLTYLWMIHFPISGCQAPEDYNSPYEFSESKDKAVWGFSLKRIKQEEQTQLNPDSGKVEKWIGDWQSLKIDYNREKKLKMKAVRVPKRK